MNEQQKKRDQMMSELKKEKVIVVSNVRRKHRIVKNAGRKARTPKRTFMKKVELVITGTDVNAIKQTAQAIYALQNDHTSGGCDNRTVQITRLDSSDVETVFYGKH